MRIALVVAMLITASCGPAAPWIKEPDKYPKPVFTDPDFNDAALLLSFLAVVPMLIIFEATASRDES